MKTSYAFFALAVGLAISPVAKADTFRFSFIGVDNTMSATGIFDATEIGNTGVYNITGIENGSFTDENNGMSVVNGPISLIPDAGSLTYISTTDGAGLDYNSPDGTEYYDNLLYYPGTPYSLDDWGGFLFSVDGYEVSIAQDIDLTIYGGWVSVLGEDAAWADYGSNIGYGEPLDGTVTPIPEPSSLLLLGTGLLGLAGVAFRGRKAHSASAK